MNTDTDSRFESILKAIEATKIHVAQAKIRVQLQGSVSEMMTFLMEYLDAVNKLKDHENQLLIMYLCEVKQGMAELKAMMRAMSISTAGRF